MKTATFAILASATLAVAQEVRFLNSAFDVVPGQPFELTFEGCDSGCTISLDNGPSDDLQVFETLTTSATGGSFTVTLDEDIPTDEYAFRITDNSSGEVNYSVQFPVEGSAPPASSSAPATSAPATTSSPATTASETESVTSETESETSVTTVTSASTVTTPATTPASSTSSRASSTRESSSTSTAEPTEIPENGASGVHAQLGLILAAAAAVAYL